MRGDGPLVLGDWLGRAYAQLPPLPTLSMGHLAIVLLTLVVPYLLGNFFFALWLFRDIQLRWGLSAASQTVFSCTLAVAFQMHILLLLMVSGHVSPLLMGNVWRIDFVLFVLLLKVVCPCVLCYAVMKKTVKSVALRVLGACALQAAWLVANFYNATTLEAEVEKLGFVGVASMALLSGWGSVAGPYQYGPWFRRAYRDEEIDSADVRLQSVLDMIGQHKRDMLVAVPRHNKPGGGRVALRQRSPVEDRVQALEGLAEELFLERVEMRGAKQAYLFSQTLLGRLYSVAGYLFALYCVFRMGAAVWSIVFPRGPNDVDVVTRAISLLFVAFSHETRRLLAQGVSFVMVGVMVFNSFRGLLVTLGKLFHQVGVLDSAVVSLLLSEVMGHYMLSSIVLLNLGLPPDFRFDVFLQFNHLRALFEILYLVAALASMFLIAVSDRDKRSRTEFYGISAAHEKFP